MRDDFAVLILTHGRPDKQITLRTLKKGNYTGRWYLVIDDEDDTADEYYERYGEHVIMFNKRATAERIDTGDNFGERRAIVFARNESFAIARQLGLQYFLQLDDDYQGLEFRFVEDEKLKGVRVPDLDRMFEAMLRFLDQSRAKTVCFAQGGDFIGGARGSNIHKGLLRKAMNTFFCRTDNPVEFLGTMNEDVSAYTLHGSRGELFFTFTEVAINQVQTQSNSRGMTDIYLDNGTYVKSFYSVLFCPSAVAVAQIGSGKGARMHHRVKWDNCVPKILDEGLKKRRRGDGTGQTDQAES